MAPNLTCNACNESLEEWDQSEHYRSDWHRYNLKRKVAGLPGVTRVWFERRRDAVSSSSRENAPSENRFSYKCTLCGKVYGNTKSYDNHLSSKFHLSKASNVTDVTSLQPVVREVVPKIRQLVSEKTEGGEDPREGNEKEVDGKENLRKVEQKLERMNVGGGEGGEVSEGEESGEEWEEVEEEEAAVLMAEDGDVLGTGIVGKEGGEEGAEREEGEEGEAELEEWEVEQCLFCGRKENEGEVTACVEHMHQHHGFFIPDSEYLMNPSKMLQYLGLKVSKGFMCLYCDDRGKSYESLEAVRQHMIDRNHCKLRWGDGSGIAEEELEEFYDYSSSYGGEENMALVLSGEKESNFVTVTSGGMELVISKEGGEGESGGTRVIGSRDMARYYRQRPPPSDSQDVNLSRALVARYKVMGLATRQPDWRSKKGKLLDSGVRASQRAEIIRSKLGWKNNVIRNLPKNVTY